MPASTSARRSFRPVGARDIDVAVVAGPRDPHPPRVAADFAVLNEAAFHVGLQVNFHLFPAIRTYHDELIVQS